MKSEVRSSINSEKDNFKRLPIAAYGTVFPDDLLIEYLKSTIDSDYSKLFWVYSKSSEDVPVIPEEYIGVGNLNLINDIHPINTYLRKVNVLMQKGQYFIIKLETKRDRKERLLNSWPVLLRKPLYVVDFLCKRVVPKMVITKKIYFWLTKGRKQVVSISEALARMIFCGFEIIDYQKVGNFTYVISKKNHEPNYNSEPTEGLIIKLYRVDKGNERIPIYKIRTMHPYSEFLQEYLYDKYGTKDGDKIENDFRVTKWGRVLRKYWIDEIPMLWNWIRRDLKIVGVRPLSSHKFNTYPPDLQMKRVQYKPGMIPPYYCDLPQSPEEFYVSERKYLDEYDKRPFFTDLKYLMVSLYNIIIKGARSR